MNQPNYVPADFETGVAPKEKIDQIIQDSEDLTIGLINTELPPKTESRYPVKVASIVKDENGRLKTEFYLEKLKSLYDRAGTRSIISLAVIGRYLFFFFFFFSTSPFFKKILISLI